MRSPMRRVETIGLAAGCVASAALLFAASGWAPWISPDTSGYVNPPPLPEAWARPRHPLFGWCLGLFPGGEYGALPAIQVGLFLLATAYLHRSLRLFGVTARAAAAVAAACLVSNLAFLWHNAVHPEMLSAVAALLAFAGTVRLAAGRPFWFHAPATALSLGLAYVLRPTFLPAIVLLPLLYGVLARLHGRTSWLALRMAVLFLACAAPFGINAGLRWQAVGDFNIVSFGGFQMSAMAGLMLSPEIVARLPDDVRPLGQAILAGRDAAEARGEVTPTPTNSRGERSFVSAAIGYYDLYARTYDALLYGPIAALRNNEPWVVWNARLMRFSLATLRAAPERYAAWLAGATSRFVGRALVANVPFVLATAALLVLYPLVLWRRREWQLAAAGGLDVPVLACLSVAYTVSAGALTVLTTFPAARYIDTAALFLPVLPIYAALCLIAALRDGSRPEPR